MIAANNGWCLSLDNLSSLPAWLSDALCRLATGGGYATRELYSDAEEALFDAMRPVMLTGIEDIVTRSDLAERALPVELPPIGEDDRRDEASFWTEYHAERPRILGALLDAVSGALGERPNVRPKRLPRLADFALWGAAVERALGWDAGAFEEALKDNRREANDAPLEDSLIAEKVARLAKGDGWCETSAALLAHLNDKADEATRREKGWPKAPNSLSGMLRRIAPNLLAVGVRVTFDEREPKGTRRKLIRIENMLTGESSTSSAPSAIPGQGADDPSPADDPPPKVDCETVRAEPLLPGMTDDRDGLDDTDDDSSDHSYEPVSSDETDDGIINEPF